MKIIGWGKYSPDKYEYMDEKEECEAEKIIVSELRKNNYHFNGFYHQNGEKGCPIFDNGKQYRTTMRNWGAIMAEAFPDEIKDFLEYSAWAWTDADEKLIKYPE